MATPAPGPLTAGAWFTTWRVEWLWLGLALVMTGVYLAGWLRLRRRGDAWPVGRVVLWVLGWAVFVYATCGGPGVYGRVLFSAHMVMHMVVAMLVPLLLVPAAPLTLALRALPSRPDKTWGPREVILQLVHSRYLGAFANPIVAAALFFFSLAVFYYSPLFGLALSTHTGHIAMMVHFLLSGYLFVWVLIGIDPGPKRWSPLLLIVILFATMAFHAFFGVSMTGSTTLLAPDFFPRLDLPWGPDPLADQQRAGRSPGASARARPSCWPCWSPWRGCERTAPRPPVGTGRPTATGMPSSPPTTHNWPSAAPRTSGPSALAPSGRPRRRGAARRESEADVRVAVIQVGYGDEEPVPARVERVAAMVRAQAGHDLVVLPELWAHGGFSYREWDERAEPTTGPQPRRWRPRRATPA